MINKVMGKVTIDRNSIVFENDELIVLRVYDWSPSADKKYYSPEKQVCLPKEIEQRYLFVDQFFEGYAIAGKEEYGKCIHLIVDLEGNEFYFTNADGTERKEYQRYGFCSDGMFVVSSISTPRLAYYHEYSSFAGIWGYANTYGREIVAPQYIFTLSFERGRALVCIGEWTRDKKWDNDYVKDAYWSEVMLWGFIDKTGKEVIPCIFDEIEWMQKPHSCDTYDAYKVHYGGWETGKWGVIDMDGEWLVEPIFEDMSYEITDDGMFAFYTAPYDSAPDHVPMGVYSIPEQRVILEPDPSFLGIDFLENGYLSTETKDKNDRFYTKIIDIKGNSIIDNPDYRVVHDLGDFYYCIQWDTDKRGVLDKNGKEVLPVKYSEIELRGMYLFAWSGDGEEVYQVVKK